MGFAPDEGVLKYLQQAEILGRLAQEELKLLAAVAERQRYGKADLIVPRSPEEDGIFVVARGGVRVYLISPRGSREIELFRRRSGDIFELGIIDPALSDETVAETMVEDTVVYVIPWLRFLTVVSRRPEAASSLAEFLLRRRAEERAVIRELAFYNMRTRLARKLVELARDNSDHIVTETHEALAAMTGTRQEEVTKTLHQFLNVGLVAFRARGRRHILVPDLDRLAQYEERTA